MTPEQWFDHCFEQAVKTSGLQLSAANRINIKRGRLRARVHLGWIKDLEGDDRMAQVMLTWAHSLRDRRESAGALGEGAGERHRALCATPAPGVPPRHAPCP